MCGHGTLQMKGRFSFVCIPRNETLQPRYFQNRIIMFCLPIPTFVLSVRDLYISRKGLSILLQPNMWTDPGNIWIAHRPMNVIGTGTAAAQFLVWEYINWIFGRVHAEIISFSSFLDCRIDLQMAILLLRCRVLSSGVPVLSKAGPSTKKFRK